MARLDSANARIGVLIRRRRIQLGWSQKKLAASLGLSYQQIQKYELGTNRISAGMIWVLSEAMNVDVQYFFQRTLSDAPASDVRSYGGVLAASDREIIELLKSYRAISDHALRIAIRRVVHRFAQSPKSFQSRFFGTERSRVGQS